MQGTFAARMKYLRQETGMDLKTLSRKSGISVDVLTRLEAGEPYITAQALDLSRAFGCNVACLVRYPDEATAARCRELESKRNASGDMKERAQCLMEIIEYTNPVIAEEFDSRRATQAQGMRNRDGDDAMAECTGILRSLNQAGVREALRQLRLLARIPDFMPDPTGTR